VELTPVKEERVTASIDDQDKNQHF